MENIDTNTIVDTNIIYINPRDKVKPDILASLLNRNVSLVYQWGASGRLPDIRGTSFTYIECLDHLVTSLLKNEEVKLFKAKEDARVREEVAQKKDAIRRTKFTDSGDSEFQEDSMQVLMAAKLEQNVRTEHAREVELWQKIAIKNGEYVNFTDKLELVQPFILQIRDLLLGIALDFPEAQETIDEGMENLFNLGTRLIEECKVDRGTYIQSMLDKKLQDIIDENK